MNLSSLVFPAVLLGIILVFFAIFMIFTKKQQQNSSINDPKKDVSRGTTKNVATNNPAEVTKEDVFKFMEFDRILDNMIVQNDGTKFTMAIKCKGINYDLMSDMEQLSVEEGFITFLNTLRYPIQLYVQAQNIDLKAAISTYKENAKGIRDEYEQVNKEYTEIVDRFDAKKEDVEIVEERRNRVLNVYEYASDIINYVEKLSLNKNLLQRNFYVLVSYYSSEITAAANFTKDEIINICYNELLTRAQSIMSGLSACSVSGTILTSNEIADLLYTAYNRDDKGLVSVREAVESGFYRLYSTSTDVFYKKQEKLIEQINKEAEIKALEALKKSIQEGTYVSYATEKMDTVEKISKTAAEIVSHEDVPKEVKQRAKEILVEDYVVNKNKVLEEIADERDKIFGKDENKNTSKKKNDDVNTSEDKERKEDENKAKEVKKEISNTEKNIKDIKEDTQILDSRLGFDSGENEKSNSNQDENSTSSDEDLII